MSAGYRNAAAAAAVLLALCAVPFLAGKFTTYLAIRIMLLGIFAVGYNLLLGQTGLLSFGHGAFYAAGAYGLGLFGVHVSNNPLLGWRRGWPRRSSSRSWSATSASATRRSTSRC